MTPNWARPISLVSKHLKLQFLWRNLILIPSFSYPKSLWRSRDETVQIHQHFHLHTTHEILYFNNSYFFFFPQFKSKNSIYKLTSRHQFIIDLKWLIRPGLEYLTWCESRLRTLLFFLMTADPPLFSSYSIFFLLIPFPPGFILPITLNLGWVLEILVFLS